MTDGKQNAPQWAVDAAREILEDWTLNWTLKDSDYLLERIVSIIERHMAQRDLAVAEAVREAVMDSACLEEFGCADTDGRYPYRIHWETVDLAPIIASVTNRCNALPVQLEVAKREAKIEVLRELLDEGTCMGECVRQLHDKLDTLEHEADDDQ